jgi:hypothetical protein
MTDGLWLDGNALGGLLGELLGFDVTSAPRGCASCGEVHPVGAHRLYRGAGLVLRCPACGDIAAVIVSRPDGHRLRLVGSWQLDIRPPEDLR